MRHLMLRKSVDALRAEAATKSEFKRVLGALDLTLLGIGAIVGTGIFVLSGHVAAFHSGPAVVVAYALAAVAALGAALCYAEIASLVAVAGSAYAYTYASMGEAAAWIIGWDLVLEYLLAAASVSAGWSAYAAAFVKHTLGYALPAHLGRAPLAWDINAKAFYWTGAWVNLPAVLIVLLLTVMLVFGVKESARINAITVFIKVAVILLFIVCAAPHIDPANWAPIIPDSAGMFGRFGWSGVLQATSILFFAYNGFDAVSAAAQEAKNPQRDLPIGILLSVAIAACLYIGVAVVLTGVVPYTQLGVPHPLSVGIEAAHVPWIQPILEIGAIAGLTSVILVNLLTQPRIAQAMARDGLLPRSIARMHPRFHTPYVATILGGVACAAAGGLLPIDVLGELMCVGTLFAFMVVSIGVVMLRYTLPDAPRTFRVPGGPLGIPLASALVCLVLMAAAQPHTILRFVAWLGVGLVVYACYGIRHSRLRRQLAGCDVSEP